MTYVQDVIDRDMIWEAISSRIVGRTKLKHSFHSMNCVMCQSRGEGPDKRRRCGIKNDSKGIGINCFNCGFKALFKIGSPLSRNMSEFLSAIGVTDDELLNIRHWVFTVQNLLEDNPLLQGQSDNGFGPIFKAQPLPVSAKSIMEWAGEGCDNPDFEDAVRYLYSRGDELFDATTYYWTPDTKNSLNRRVIIPCYHEGKIAGWSARGISDDIKPKYWNQFSGGILFNGDALFKPVRKYAIIVEGIFDALAIDAIAIMKADINDQQALWIDSSDKIKIVVPDRDQAGARIVRTALKYNWSVAFPYRSVGYSWWEHDIKDVADAVKRYGSLWTLRSIIASSTNNKTEIGALRNSLAMIAS